MQGAPALADPLLEPLPQVFVARQKRIGHDDGTWKASGTRPSST